MVISPPKCYLRRNRRHGQTFQKRQTAPITKPMLNMRDFEKNSATKVKVAPEDSPNYTTSPGSPGSESDSSSSSVSTTAPSFASPPAKKIAFKPYRVKKTKPATRKQLAVGMVAGHVELLKRNTRHPLRPQTRRLEEEWPPPLVACRTWNASRQTLTCGRRLLRSKRVSTCAHTVPAIWAASESCLN